MWRLPLTIEALHTVGVGLELEPAVEVVLDALFALVMLRSTSVRGRICARTDTSLTPAARAGGRAEGGRYRRECAHLRHSRAGLAVCRRPTLLSHRTQVRLNGEHDIVVSHQRRRRARVAGAELASVAINIGSTVRYTVAGVVAIHATQRFSYCRGAEFRIREVQSSRSVPSRIRGGAVCRVPDPFHPVCRGGLTHGRDRRAGAVLFGTFR